LFSKILVPVDGSDISYRALDSSLFLSETERLGSKITAIHVIEKVPTVYIQSQKILDEILETHKNESQKILDECSSIATKKGIAINTTLLEGNPASTILEFSQMEKYEVIIIGS
jgi:Universal stress protein family